MIQLDTTNDTNSFNLFYHMLLLLTSVKSDDDLFKIEIAITQIKISLITVSLVY